MGVRIIRLADWTYMKLRQGTENVKVITGRKGWYRKHERNKTE